MSKTERRKLFQPIPLSSILDPTYQSPFSKLEQFQLDMEISNCKAKTQPTVWQKLQSSLLSAMSNFIIMSQPVFASSTTSVSSLSQRSHCMSLVPLKSYSPCELILHEEIESHAAVRTDAPEPHQKPSSLYHSVRSGLQCLRYLATHPVQSEDNKRQHVPQTLTPTRHHYNCRKQNKVVLPEVGYSIGGGALFYPFLSTVDCASRYSLSAPTSPSHLYRHQSSNFVASHLFSWAMSGLLLASPIHNRHLNALYKNYCLFSPIHCKGAEVTTTRLSTQKNPENKDIMSSSPHTTKVESNIEIFIHSSSRISQDNEMSLHCSTTSPTKEMSTPNLNNKTVSSEVESSGCIRIETNWRPFNGENSNCSNNNRSNFHTVSVCSASPTLKGGTLTFSCSSTMSTSPRAIVPSGRTMAKRLPTESESSTDSYVEFSASVESTDSFCIVFESAAGGCIDGEFDKDEDEEWEDDDDEDDDSDDDGEDQIFNYSSSASDDIFVDGYIFHADGLDEGIHPCDQVDRGAIPNKRNKAKTVSFDEEHLVTILEFEDDSASKSSRETYWEMLARDRSRFQDRVKRMGDILEPILSSGHRQKIYQQRFLQAKN